MIHSVSIQALSGGSGSGSKVLSARNITRIMVAQTATTLSTWTFSISDRAGGQFFPWNTGDTLPVVGNVPLIFDEKIGLLSDPAEVVITVNNTGAQSGQLTFVFFVTDNPRRELEELLQAVDRVYFELCKLTHSAEKPGK